MRKISIDERRARAARRHLAAPAATTAGGAAGDGLAGLAQAVVAVHSTDAVSVFLAAAARSPTASVEAIERDIYADRTVVRVLAMRRTVFVVPVELARVVLAACSQAIAARERRRLVPLLEAAGIAGDGAGWLRGVEEETVAALAARGQATAVELSADVPALRQQVVYGEGSKWAATLGVSTRVLGLLGAEGRIVRGRPQGSWASTRYRWAPMDDWLAGGSAPVPAPVAAEPARAELARRWLAAYGPGTEADVRWWTGWTLAETRRALAAVAPVEVDMGGRTGLVLPGDEAPVPPAEPGAVLLPALDSTVMGWYERDWYLGGHGPLLFDRNGNAGPTVWWDGRVVGGWAQRPGGEVVLRLLEDVGTDAVDAVEAEADRLRRWLGDVRVTPRFRTPLERELAG